ncbi:hypothetical protein RYX36_027621 [Vicia faba]
MKLLEVLLVMCILFWAFIGSTTMAARKTVFVGNLFDGANKKNKNNSSVAVLDDSVHRCKNHKKIHVSSCYNDTSSSEDKRVVPTGPNPLHNR